MLPMEEREALFRRLYEAHYGAIASYAHRRLGEDEADDLIAETFLVAWRRLEDVPTGDLARPWLYEVARRTASESRRSAGRWGRLRERLVSLRPTDPPMAPTQEVEDRDTVHRALSSLRPQDRELLLLSEWEDLDHRQLGSMYGCSANAIAIRLHRAHRRFRQAVESADRDTLTPEDDR